MPGRLNQIYVIVSATSSSAGSTISRGSRVSARNSRPFLPILVSVVYDFGKLLQNMIVNAYNGKLTPGKFYRYGLDGYSVLIPNPALASEVSKDTNAKVASLIEDIKSGAIKVPEFHKAGESLTFDLSKLKAK